MHLEDFSPDESLRFRISWSMIIVQSQSQPSDGFDFIVSDPYLYLLPGSYPDESMSVVWVWSFDTVSMRWFCLSTPGVIAQPIRDPEGKVPMRYPGIGIHIYLITIVGQKQIQHPHRE